MLANRPPMLTIAQLAEAAWAPTEWRRQAREAIAQGRGDHAWNTLPGTRSYGPYEAEDHARRLRHDQRGLGARAGVEQQLARVAAASAETGGSLPVSTTLPGPPDEPVMREGFYPQAEATDGGAYGNDRPVMLTGDLALAYAEFRAAACDLEAAGLAVQAAQKRFQAALAKLSPLAAKAT